MALVQASYCGAQQVGLSAGDRVRDPPVSRQRRAAAAGRVVAHCDEWSAKACRRCPKLLIERGADVNAANDEGVRPLHTARADIIPAVLEAGADLEGRNATG
jgi:ankyrin repeat protein